MKKNFFSPAIIFILGFLTLGLGNNASIYIISDRLITDGEGSPLYPMREAVLNIITFGFYGIYWTFKISKALCSVSESPSRSFTVLTTLLSALPFRCVSMALITNKILILERHCK